MGKQQRGVNYPAVLDSDVKKQKIPLPSVTEQIEMASILDIVDSKINSEYLHKKSLEELFNSTLSELMSAKILANNLEI